MKPVDINTDFKTYFNGDDLINDIFEDVKHLYNDRTVEVSDYKFKPAELILPNIYKSDFETGMDSITTIRNNPNYFVDKLQKQFELADDTSDFIISLGSEKPKIYVKYVVDLPTANSKVSIITDREEVDGELKTVKLRLDELGNKMYTLPENSKVIIDDNGKETLYIKAASKHISKVVSEYHIIDENLSNTIKSLIKSFNGKIDAIIPTMNSTFKEYVERFDKDGNLLGRGLIDSNIHKITLKEFAKFSGIAVNLSNFRQDTLHEDFNNIKNDIINKIALNKRIS